jgi:hypothetical protein
MGDGWWKLSSQGCVIRGVKYKRFIPGSGQAYGRSSDEAAVKAWAKLRQITVCRTEPAVRDLVYVVCTVYTEEPG